MNNDNSIPSQTCIGHVHLKVAEINRSPEFYCSLPGFELTTMYGSHAATNIIRDRYGVGSVAEALEKKFTDITGKAKSIFMPSGTMANQLAIAVLSGDNTKVFVQDTSHVYRDEADAAQSVFKKSI